MEYKKIIDYSGRVQYETIGELINVLKQKVHDLGIHIGTYKRLLLIMIEALENIMKHSESPSEETNASLHFSPLFAISREGQNYIIRASNSMKEKNRKDFTNRIDYLNTLDEQGLKELYKETIIRAGFNDQGGAGLGLIEMAKISHNGIHYEFIPIDEEFTQFNLKIEIEK